ncbi:hypothetical protein [Allosphingosinicella vermicomposti]|uniref:DUF7947 five-stranded beta-barrel domain-containing protein n=1 Tax=Allosphingosinicella vermicomposti TaxID=614671 RepID=UPI000D10BCB0|nr:hypothetical protein [Allosphingosinicella vermicomposti]
MVSDCIIIFSQMRLPKRGERAPLVLKVREAEAGSHNTPAFYQELSELLAVGVPIVSAIGPEILSHYVSAILDRFRGKGDAVEAAIAKMAEMHRATVEGMTQMQRDALEALDRKDARQHEEHMGLQEILRRAIEASGGAAVDYVAPVGRSVDTALFKAGGRAVGTVNKEDADAIRESQKLDWKPLGELPLRTDGFKFHSNGLSVENPERDGYMMAEVNDPAFYEESNAYTMAAQKRGRIMVLARKGYKNGALAKIQIVNFVRELDGDA